MEPENKALAVILLAFAIVVGVGSVYFLTAPAVVPSPVLIPAGTTFSRNSTLAWVVYFNISTAGMRLVGAWTAFTGAGSPVLVVVNGTVTPPSGLLYSCARLSPWAQFNGSIDTSESVGPHTVYWNTICSYALGIVVTETIRLVPGLQHV
jgi:hypothetical protein